MIGSIITLGGIILIVYIIIKERKMNSRSKKRFKRLELVYSLGLKEYNKSIARKLNQTQPTIIS